jgi:hypothetical protein
MNSRHIPLSPFTGVEMAYPLFLQKNIMGVLSVAAKLHPEWKSTVEAAPSPK